MKKISNNSPQWKSSPKNSQNLLNSDSKKSIFRTLNNTHHLTSYFKNGILQNKNIKPQSRSQAGENSNLKRRLLDLKCKLSRLQGEKAKKRELEQRLSELQNLKNEEEKNNRAEIDKLMRSLSGLKGELEEQKMQIKRVELQKNLKNQDLKKMEELVNAKEEELEELQQRGDSQSLKKNRLLGERDSLGKEGDLLRQESARLDLESGKLERELRETQGKHKTILNQTGRIQVEKILILSLLFYFRKYLEII